MPMSSLVRRSVHKSNVMEILDVASAMLFFNNAYIETYSLCMHLPIVLCDGTLRWSRPGPRKTRSLNALSWTTIVGKLQDVIASTRSFRKATFERRFLVFLSPSLSWLVEYLHALPIWCLSMLLRLPPVLSRRSGLHLQLKCLKCALKEIPGTFRFLTHFGARLSSALPSCTCCVSASGGDGVTGHISSKKNLERVSRRCRFRRRLISVCNIKNTDIRRLVRLILVATLRVRYIIRN